MAHVTTSPDKLTKVNLSVFEARHVRDVLKNKAHCLNAGFPKDHMIISVFDDIRDDYVKRVGLATYLSQMLGDLANVPAQNCTFFDEGTQSIEVHLNGHGQQPVQRFVAQHFGQRNLPFRVDIRSQPDSHQAETRYL